jgi:hypothetical protein
MTLRSVPGVAKAVDGASASRDPVVNARGATRAGVELTRFGGHLTSWEDVHDAEGKAAVSA